MQLKTICFAILFFVQISLGHTDHHGQTNHDTDHHNTLHDRCISALKKKIFKGTSMSLLINSTKRDRRRKALIFSFIWAGLAALHKASII